MMTETTIPHAQHRATIRRDLSAAIRWAAKRRHQGAQQMAIRWAAVKVYRSISGRYCDDPEVWALAVDYTREMRSWA